MNYHLTPHITEKSYAGIAGEGKLGPTYTFAVDRQLDKDLIRKLVEKEHKVTVTNVRTIRLPGRDRRFRGIPGRIGGIKKALVTLKKGDRIAAFEVDKPAADTSETPKA